MKTSSGDFKNFSGSELNLLETHVTTMKHQMRFKLLKNLRNLNLSTRDIFFFIKGQADRRTFKKTQDWVTMASAMRAKMLDIKAVIRMSYYEREKARLQLLEEYNGKKFKLRRCIGRIRKHVQKEKTKMWEKYKTKINHYRKKQIMTGGVTEFHKNDEKFNRPTVPTGPLKKY